MSEGNEFLSLGLQIFQPNFTSFQGLREDLRDKVAEMQWADMLLYPVAQKMFTNFLKDMTPS